MELFLFMTLSASLLILAALLLRPLTGKVFPRSMQMLLWMAASLRLLIPVRITVPFSLFSLFTSHSGTASILESTVNPVILPEKSSRIFTISAELSTLTPASSVSSVTFSEILPWIWLAGTVLTAAVLLFLHCREMRRCRFRIRDKKAEQLVSGNIRIYRCCAVSAPFVSGLFFPKIVLPADLPAQDLSAVLAHEAAHIRGLDILKKYIFFAALCVNWFNPLVWIMVRLSAQDIEILCDQRTLLAQNAPDPKAYAHALLNAEEHRTLFALTFKSHAEVRITKILKREKISRAAALFSVLLVLFLTAACASYPATDTHGSGISFAAPDLGNLCRKNEASAEETQELFMQKRHFGVSDFQANMSLEDARSVIRTMGVVQDPVLQTIPHAPERVYFTVPCKFLGYSGEISLYFDDNALKEILVDFAFKNADTAAASYDILLTELGKAFGARKPYTNIVTDAPMTGWSNSYSSLFLLTVPHGLSDDAAHTVRIHINCVHKTVTVN